MSEPRGRLPQGAPERLYSLAEDRARRSGRADVELVTLIVARAEPEAGTRPECASLLRMCQFPLSVAEISAYLALPVSTVTLLLTDLLRDDQVETRAPVPAAALPDPELLQAVMHGLQKL
ncbi:DUF742 domain-containing protein [Streptomyces milbemycinicus]|uniref:DUF742 domain-containing protein n=1 Tax=Streptomyces milbemycinicus TaxID=476552 RepID=A0ABW8LJD9_9ACTN